MRLWGVCDRVARLGGEALRADGDCERVPRARTTCRCKRRLSRRRGLLRPTVARVAVVVAVAAPTRVGKVRAVTVLEGVLVTAGVAVAVPTPVGT